MKYICVMGRQDSGKTTVLNDLRKRLSNVVDFDPSSANTEARCYGEYNTQNGKKIIMIWGTGDSACMRQTGLKWLQQQISAGKTVDVYVFASHCEPRIMSNVKKEILTILKPNHNLDIIWYQKTAIHVGLDYKNAHSIQNHGLITGANNNALMDIGRLI